MARWRRAIARLHCLLTNQRAEEELAREVASHLALLADDFERRGMSPEEARLDPRFMGQDGKQSRGEVLHHHQGRVEGAQ